MATASPARRADSIRLGPWHQGAVYAATAALAVTGIIWLVLHYFLPVSGEYGPQIHPLEPWMLRLHGAAAMAGLIIYGSLLPVHIRRAWSIVPVLLAWHIVSGRARTRVSESLREQMENDG